MDERVEIIVVGGGHAGLEAAVAAARMGCEVALITLRAERVGEMSCNPAIGGLAKGHLVREIDALGGAMGQLADESCIQYRTLNTRKGHAVRAGRSQNDRGLYRRAAVRLVRSVPGLRLIEGEVAALALREEGGERAIAGCRLRSGRALSCDAVVLCAGTFLRGLMHTGEVRTRGGRRGEPAAGELSSSLAALGFELGRLKTGTPPRLARASIDFTQLEEQPGDENPRGFSFWGPGPQLAQVPCHITHTTARTHELIRASLDRSPLYSGRIEGVGPRYCPSIEDKVVRFPERRRHQIFLEPEGLESDSIYANGISTSLPADVQEHLVRTIPGLERARFLHPGYAIEYDFVHPSQIDWTLQTRSIRNLFLAGQVNGTSGYEEAAAQGLVAGINAALGLRGAEPFVLERCEAYIGVLIDDLVRSTPAEPYRMFTSRAEHRLLLREDNADRRLAPRGFELGLVGAEQLARVRRKAACIARVRRHLETHHHEGRSLATLLKRPEMDYAKLALLFPELERFALDEDEICSLEVDVKYAGYRGRQRAQIDRQRAREHQRIPASLPLAHLEGLRAEAREKLAAHRPPTVGAAARIDGVTPADIDLLLVHLERHRRAF